MTMLTGPVDEAALQILKDLEEFIDDAVARNGGDTRAVRPNHRIKFHWPPHPISYEYHVLASDWSGEAEMLQNLRHSSEPLFKRQLCVNECLNRPGRFTGHIRDLSPSDIVKLLYCRDRDIANEARTEIETHASQRVFTPALVQILNDRRHPYRRSAQWCVLDLFEDLPSFCRHEDEEEAAIEAMRDLIWDAEDDYARTS